MSAIIYVTAGEKLKQRGKQLVIQSLEEEHLIHLKDISVIVVESTQCSITVGAHLLCSSENVPLIICNQKHQPEVFCYSQYSYHRLTERIKEQMLWATKAVRLPVMAKIIRQKIIHQAELLTYFTDHDPSTLLFQDYCLQLEKTEDQQAIATAEAVCARMYFTALF